MTAGPDLDEAIEIASLLSVTADRVVGAALDHGADALAGGRRIDDAQPHAERLAYLATEARAARELTAYARRARAAGRLDDLTAESAAVYAGLTVAHLAQELLTRPGTFGVEPDAGEALLLAPVVRRATAAALDDTRAQRLGAGVIAARGQNLCWLGDEVAEMARDSVRQFARSEVAPLAERIHRDDELVPDQVIGRMAELGFFGTTIPVEYGGAAMGSLVMVVTTEELSAASLGAAGSLITRPEILAKALLTGGTEAQKRAWLPRIAAGEIMVGVAVTEPDVGSDVASLSTRAVRGEWEGRPGWRITGAKAWSTFSGRADVLALLARTDADPASGSKGLTLFIVPKDPFYGRQWEMVQPEGGRIVGTANPTPGYRGMHSFTLAIDDYWVPAENVVGEEAGVGRGFALQMTGFAAGRLQTGGRACGVAQAAIERAADYVAGRVQFGRPIAEYTLTQHRVGTLWAQLAAARALTYAAAAEIERPGDRGLGAAMAKLLACDVAVTLTQAGQQLHGGWGYSEEQAISRYVVDALVLPIFEGVKPILELKVIARALLAHDERPRHTQGGS